MTLDPGQTATMQFTLNYHYADDGLALPTGTSAPSGPFGPPLGPAGPVLVTNFTGPAGYTGPTATHEAASFFVDMSGCAAGSGSVSCLPTSVGSFLGNPASNTFPYDNGRFSGVVISNNSVPDSFDGQASFVAHSTNPATAPLGTFVGPRTVTLSMNSVTTTLYSVNAVTSPVPEPGTYALMGVGLLALLTRRRLLRR